MASSTRGVIFLASFVLTAKADTPAYWSTMHHAPHNASKLFLRLAQTPNPHPPCTNESFARIIQLTTILGHAAIDIDDKHVCSNRQDPGFCGIFSKNYKQSKSRFMYDELCARFPPGGPPPHVCELGFMKGQTAVLFLETHPQATLQSFDLGDLAWTPPAAELVRKAYGASRFNMSYGYSSTTLPEYAASTVPTSGRKRKVHAMEAATGRKCSVALVDGQKNREGRLSDLRQVRSMSTPETQLFFDEVTSHDCVASAERCPAACEEDRKRSHSGAVSLWDGATLSYCDATREGLLAVEKCAWARALQDMDGMCSGRFL